MTESAKSFFEWLNRWSLVLQLVVTIATFTFFIFRVDANIVDVKEFQKQYNQEHNQNHQFYVSNMTTLVHSSQKIEESLEDKEEDHKQFYLTQIELLRVMDKLVLVLDNVNSELQRRQTLK